ncbi:MAG: hypothetical protein C4543_05270 [Ignavibacteriales bacterium]|jgi:hypothetical protein|nr:hypothetical protein [Melioribacteraceae bacterium]RJP60384.1 MAG: hypothetical protein C4543_05270 [Ignavibacteriales bacterium]
MTEIDQHLSNNNLTRLSKYLNYQISTVGLFVLSFLSFGFIFLVTIAAIIFTPFMLYVLYKENKNGWIVFFIILVVIPFILSTILHFTVTFIFPWYLIVLVIFYFYCFLLRLEVNNWMRERRSRLQYLLEKQRREDETEVFMTQFNK